MVETGRLNDLLADRLAVLADIKILDAGATLIGGSHDPMLIARLDRALTIGGAAGNQLCTSSN
jgi:predicted ABC-type transport system involved in lysophospholipase L1 biosynthesis ATPase subunit